MEEKRLRREDELKPEELNRVVGGDSFRQDWGPPLERGSKFISGDGETRVEILETIGHDPVYGYEYRTHRDTYVDIPGLYVGWKDLGDYKCTDSIVRGWSPTTW